ncbi:hypothetical protein ACSAZL_11275 [Methanosarcina sp. T3]|uniref:hypothetical protein n=1 Tax=Methanosarcina sp. T3 TaxID=3439062 RepID=UPI003F83D7B3
MAYLVSTNGKKKRQNDFNLLLSGDRLAVASEEGVLLFKTEDPYNSVELGFIGERGTRSLEKRWVELWPFTEPGRLSLCMGQVKEEKSKA